MTDIHLSRHAIDSTEEAMDMTFSMRIPHDLRILAGEEAKVLQKGDVA